MRHRPVLLLLLALAVAPYFVGLGDSAIWDANEAFYAQTPREMLARGDLLNPSFNGQPRFNKPPLSYWIVAGFYQVFGDSIVVERLAITLGALILIAAAFGVGRAVFSTEAGLLAALALAASPRVLMLARRIFIDVYIAMFLGLVLLCFVLAETRPAGRRRYLVLMYVAIALGFLTKGPIAVVLPGLAVLIYLAVNRRLHDLRDLMLPTGTLIVAAIVLPWYFAIYAEHGWLHIRRFFIEENLSRYTAPYGEKVDARGPFFYVPVLLSDLFPWSLFGVVALGAFAWRWWRDRSEQAASLLVAWVVAIVGFFSLSQSKQDLYIFPAATALAALAGGLVARGLSGADDRAGSAGLRTPARWVAALAGVLMLTAGAGVLYLFTSPARVYAIEGATATGLVAVVGGVVAAALAWRRRVFGAIAALVLTMVAVNWLFVLLGLPSFRQYQPVPAMAERIQAEADPAARIGYFKMGLPSLAYYVNRPVFEAFDLEQIRAVFASGEAWCLMRANDYAEVAPHLPGPTCVKAVRPAFDVKLGNMIALKPLPTLVLVSNACS
jgi:4-amino-4-deoxy-L-arabinose transferase-like glycosyltransferase